MLGDPPRPLAALLQRGNLSKINVYVTYMSRIRHVYVTSPLAKVAFTYTRVDAYRIFQNLQALTLETESFKSLSGDVTYTFTKAYLGVLLVYVKHYICQLIVSASKFPECTFEQLISGEAL